MDYNIERVREVFSGPRAYKVKISGNDRRIFPWSEAEPGSPNFWQVSISPLTVLQCLKDKPDTPIERINEVHNIVLDGITEELAKPSICNDLKIEKVKVTLSSFEKFMEIVALNQNLLKLYLWRCEFGDKCGIVLEQTFSHNNRIKLLDLTDCYIGDEGAIGIGKALMINKTLRKLNLHRNNIKDNGAIELGKALQVNKTLFTLILSDNFIGESGAMMISLCLLNNKTLGFLYLNGNILKDNGACSIANMIRENKGLMELNLTHCRIGEHGISRIWTSLAFNNTLFKIDIFEGNLPSRGTYNLDTIKVEVTKQIEANKLRQKKLFLQALKKNKSGPWGRTRLLFIGQGKAGKTATVRALLSEPFKETHESTIGADLKQLSTRADHESGWGKQEPRDFTSHHAARILAERHYEMLLKDEVPLEESKVIASPSVAQTKTNPYRKVSSALKVNMKMELTTANPTPIQRRYSLPGEPQMPKKKPKKDNVISSENVGDLASRLDLHDYMNAPFEQTMAFRSRLDKEALNFTLWDFGGQDVFYTMHHIFMSSHGLYLLVFNSLEVLAAYKGDTVVDDNHPQRYLTFWLNSVAVHAPDTSVLLVGTHIDELEAETKELNDINEFILSIIQPKQDLVKVVENKEDGFCFFPVSNKNLVGIHQLQVVIEKEARQQGHVELQVPIRWMACLDKLFERTDKAVEDKKKTKSINDLPRMKRKPETLTLDEVKGIGQLFDIIAEDEIDEMLKLFNDLGVLIYLTSNPVLRNKVILQPQWLINVLGKVIRDRRLHVEQHEFETQHLIEDYKLGFEHGLFSYDLLEYLWKNEDHGFLIELMKSTMLLSEWDFAKDGEKYFLVPSLLKTIKNNNKISSKNNSRGSLSKLKKQNFQVYECFFDFSLKYLPIGIFERVICLVVSFSTFEFLLDHQYERKVLRNFKQPTLANNYCRVSLNQAGTLSLVLELVEEELKIILRIESSVKTKDPIPKLAHKALLLVQNAIEQVNSEVMKSSLRWKKMFLSKDAEIEEEEALSLRLYPWFENTIVTRKFSLEDDNLFEEF